MNRDIVVGIIGTCVLVAAMVGVFLYERNNAGTTGTGPDTGGPGGALASPAPVTGSTAVGQSKDATILVNATSASTVTFTLTWTPSQTSKDTLSLAIKPPAGATIQVNGTQQSDAGKIEVSVPVPSGVSPAGTWTATVKFVSASPTVGGVTPPTNPLPPGTGTDASVSWSLATALK
jgi:hypothetical protein